MKAIKHKPTGQWLMVNESEEYELTDCRVPIDGCIGTDEEILQDIEDYSDGELLAADMEVMELIMLTPAELEAKDRNLLIDHHKWYRKWRLSVNDSSVETTVDEYFKWKEAQQ